MRGAVPAGRAASLAVTPVQLDRPSLAGWWRVFRSQSAGFQLACFYVFLEFFRPQSYLPFLEVLRLPMLSLVLGTLVMLPEASRNGWTRVPTNGLLVAYAVVVAVSLLFAGYPGYGLGKWDYFVPWLVAYVLIANTVNTRDRFLLLLLVYGLCNLKLTQFGLRSWIMGGGSFAGFGLRGPKGWFQNSGELAIQTAMFTPLALMMAMALWEKFGRWGKLAIALVPLSALFTTIGTHSRGGIIAMAAAVAWALLGYGIRLRTIVLASVLGVAGLFLVGEDTWQRFETMGEDTTSIRRMTFFQDGLEIIGDHPVIGVGYFNWIPYYSRHYPPVDEVKHLAEFQLPHNILIQCGAELGFLGLIVFAMLVASNFVLNRRTRQRIGQRDPLLRLIAHGFDASMIAFLIAGQFVTVLYYPYFWITLALTVALHEASRREYGVAMPSREFTIGRPRQVSRSGRRA